MTTAVANLLTLTGVLIVGIGVWAGFWIWLDAREAAVQRKHQQEMADAAVRRVTQARDARYLTSDPNRPE